MKNKTIFALTAVTLVVAGINILVWWVSRDTDPQLAWIGFILVWFNLLLGWLTFARQRAITYLFFSIALLIEIILVVNKYWILSRGL